MCMCYASAREPLKVMTPPHVPGLSGPPPHVLSVLPVAPFPPPYRLILLCPLQWGSTPLHAAAGSGHAPVVALLLATPGVDPTLEDEVSIGGESVGSVARLPDPCPFSLL